MRGALLQACGALQGLQHTCLAFSQLQQEQQQHGQQQQQSQGQQQLQACGVGYRGWFTSLCGWLKRVMEQLECSQLLLQEVARPLTHAGTECDIVIVVL